MQSQPPPPPSEGKVNLPSASMARPQLTSWAPSPQDEPEPLPMGSQAPPGMGQSQNSSTSMRPTNSPTSHLQSARAGGASQLPSYSQSGNYQSPPSFGQRNQPPNNTPTGYSQSGRPIQPSNSSLGELLQIQRVPSSSHYQNVGQSQSQRIPSNSQFQNVGQTQSGRVPSNSQFQNVGQSQSQRAPSNSQYQNAEQSNTGRSISSSKYSNGQRLDPPGHTGMPTILETGSLQPGHSRSGSLGPSSSRSSSRRPTAQGGQSIMASKLDITRGGNRQSYMPPKLDLTRSQALNAPPPNAPKNQPSILRSNYDIKMASKQLNFASMSGREKQEQNSWVQSKLKGINDGCNEGYDWEKRPGGYQCKGGAHAVTDKLIAEGKGGIYRLVDKQWESEIPWKGPYYQKENGDWVRNTGNDAPKS